MIHSKFRNFHAAREQSIPSHFKSRDLDGPATRNWGLLSALCLQVWSWFGGTDDAPRERLRAYTDVDIQHWPNQKYILEDDYPTTIHPHPHPVAALSSPEWDGMLHFASSESDQRSPGVMKGAVGAALRVLEELEDETSTS